MAKNIDVINAFVNGDSKPKTTNLKIEGDKLINYGTVIAERNGDQLIVNVTKYSVSTTTIQNKLIGAIAINGLEDNVKYVHDVRMGANSLT